MKQILLVTSILFFFWGCSIKNIDKDSNNNTKNQLENLIISMSPKIDKNEAKNISMEAIEYSKYLAKKYDAIKPALLQNTLVNLGYKEKGLCFDYANDLLTFLREKNYKSFKFIKVVSSRGDYFEHTAFILTRDDISFYESIIFDAWRDTGELYFSKIKDDKKYKWEIK